MDRLLMVRVDVVNENRISFTSDKNAAGVKFLVKGKIEVNRDLGQKLVEYTARALMRLFDLFRLAIHRQMVR